MILRIYTFYWSAVQNVYLEKGKIFQSLYNYRKNSERKIDVGEKWCECDKEICKLTKCSNFHILHAAIYVAQATRKWIAS